MASKVDGLVKSLKGLFPSFPWKRESSFFKALQIPWIPACAGMATFYEIIKVNEFVKNRHPSGNRSPGYL
jgi:hypothetical protein